MITISQTNTGIAIKHLQASADYPQATAAMVIETLAKFLVSPDLLSKQIAQQALDAHYRASVKST